MGDLRPGAHRPSATTAWVRFLAVVATLGLVVTGCSSPDEAPSAGGDAELGASADINPQDPATLQQGGNLRLALSGFPPNFNYLHIDGKEYGSLYIHHDQDGPLIELGQYDPDADEWVQRAQLRPIRLREDEQ